MRPIDISVVIPAKDEEGRLPKFLNNLLAHVQQSKYVYEIIVVNDGSVDGTGRVAEQGLAGFTDGHVVNLKINHGKGYAVKQGMLRAKGHTVLFMDADGSTPPSEIEPNLTYLDQGYAVVIGSRVKQSPLHHVKVPWRQKGVGIVFNWLVHHLLIEDIEDTQCGFKIFRGDIVRPLFSRLYIDDFAFDLEVLYLAKRGGWRVKEVPVNWSYVEGNKVRLWRDAPLMFINMLQLRLWHYGPLSVEHAHMSDQEVAQMALREKDHWWFISKGYFIKAIMSRFIKQTGKFLDAGCGSGYNMALMNEQVFYVGADASSAALHYCQANGHQRLVQSDLKQLPFKQDSVDVILSLDVLEHIDDPDRVLREFFRLVKPGGQLLITVPAFRFLFNQHDVSLSHLRRYHAWDMSNMLKEAGFSIQAKGYLFHAVFFPLVVFRLLRRLLRGADNPRSDFFQDSPAWLNTLMVSIARLEAALLGRLPIPFGTSLWFVALKEKDV